MTAKPIPKSLESIDARRILVIKPSALGDICHALPVLDFLRERFQKAEIDWVANKSFAPILKNHSFINEVIEFDSAFADLMMNILIITIGIKRIFFIIKIFCFAIDFY